MVTEYRFPLIIMLTHLCLVLTSCGTTPTTDWPAADSDRALEHLSDNEEVIFQAPYENRWATLNLRDQRLGSMLTLSDERIHLGNASISYANIFSAKLDDPLVPYYVKLTLFDGPPIELRLIRRTWREMRNINRLHRIMEKKMLEANDIREKIQKESSSTVTIKDINRMVAEEMRHRSLAKQKKRRAEMEKRLGTVGMVLRNRSKEVAYDRKCPRSGAGGGAMGTGIPPVDLIIFIGGMATAISQDIEKIKCEKRSDPNLDIVSKALVESLSRVLSEGSNLGRVTQYINRELGSPVVELSVFEDPDSIKGKVDTLIEVEPSFGLVQTYSYYALHSTLDVRLIRVKDNHILDQKSYQHVSKNVCNGIDCHFDEPLKQAFSYFGFKLANDVLQ